MCDISCNTTEYVTEYMNEFNEEVREDNLYQFDFINKQFKSFLKLAKAVDDKSNNKLLIEGDKACQIFRFEEIGTYIQNTYVACTEDMSKMKLVLAKVFKMTAKENSTE